jgi:hypothetical protein
VDGAHVRYTTKAQMIAWTKAFDTMADVCAKEYKIAILGGGLARTELCRQVRSHLYTHAEDSISKVC